MVNGEADTARLDPALGEHLHGAFDRGPGHGLLYLGVDHAGTALPPVLAYWREFATRYVTALCTSYGESSGSRGPVAPLSTSEFEFLVLSAPPMRGGEYLTGDVFASLWHELDAAFAVELSESGCEVQDFLKRRNSAWNLVGRVHFNLAENRKDPDAPFAFLATYTSRLSAQAKVQHAPLGQALREYAGAANKGRLLSLLVPVQRASETCPWLKAMVDAGEIFHPLRWTPREALQLLSDGAHLEAAGVVVRMPAGWGGNRPPRPRVTASVGAKPPSGIGQEALLDFQMDITLEGESLTAAEIRDLLAHSDGLALVRGRWIELDREHLQRTIDRFEEVQRAAGESGLPFGEAMRLLAGAGGAAGDDVESAAEWAQVVAGPWLADTLRGLRSPQGLAQIDPGEALHGALRPYQQVGLRWLYLLSTLGLGACLADDMGLGKTIQVLSLLLVLQRPGAAPSLLVAPASLLANWAAEIERFAPGLKMLIAHPSAVPAAELKALSHREAGGRGPGGSPVMARCSACTLDRRGRLATPGGSGRGAGHQEPGFCPASPRGENN